MAIVQHVQDKIRGLVLNYTKDRIISACSAKTKIIANQATYGDKYLKTYGYEKLMFSYRWDLFISIVLFELFLIQKK